MLKPIKVPLLNPNEPEALLAQLLFNEGAAIKAGQVLAVIETTKSTGEVLAEETGYLVGLCFQEGNTLIAGDVLGYIADAPDARDESLLPWAIDTQRADPENQSDLRMTEPARALALAEGVNLNELPRGVLVTTQLVQAVLADAQPVPVAPPQDDGDRRMLIYGAGGHGCSLAALVQHLGGYEIVGFLDDGVAVGAVVDGIPVLGGGEKLAELAATGIRLAVNGVGGVGDLSARLSVYRQLSQVGLYCPSVIHRTSFLEGSAELSDGVQVYPQAYVGVRVRVGYGAIINTGAIVSHDCQLSPYVNLSPGATLAGGVTVGEAALIGMRATVNLNVRVGNRARVGNGATVKADVPDGGVVPAGAVWPLVSRTSISASSSG